MSLDRSTFYETQKALKEYDKHVADSEPLWAQIKVAKDVVTLHNADMVAVDRVRRAFYNDTRAINHWDQVAVVSIQAIREIVQSAGRLAIRQKWHNKRLR